MLSLRELRRRGPVTYALRAYCHTSVTDFSKKVGVAEYVSYRILVEGISFSGEIASFVQPYEDLHVRILVGSVTF